jgi:hypothetical protein
MAGVNKKSTQEVLSQIWHYGKTPNVITGGESNEKQEST